MAIHVSIIQLYTLSTPPLELFLCPQRRREEQSVRNTPIANKSPIRRVQPSPFPRPRPLSSRRAVVLLALVLLVPVLLLLPLPPLSLYLSIYLSISLLPPPPLPLPRSVLCRSRVLSHVAQSFVPPLPSVVDVDVDVVPSRRRLSSRCLPSSSHCLESDTDDSDSS